jgi:hypothetical protein
LGFAAYIVNFHFSVATKGEKQAQDVSEGISVFYHRKFSLVADVLEVYLIGQQGHFNDGVKDLNIQIPIKIGSLANAG